MILYIRRTPCGQTAVEGDASVSSIKYLSTSVNSKYNYKYKYKFKYHVSCVNAVT